MLLQLQAPYWRNSCWPKITSDMNQSSIHYVFEKYHSCLSFVGDHNWYNFSSVHIDDVVGAEHCCESCKIHLSALYNWIWSICKCSGQRHCFFTNAYKLVICKLVIFSESQLSLVTGIPGLSKRPSPEPIVPPRSCPWKYCKQLFLDRWFIACRGKSLPLPRSEFWPGAEARITREPEHTRLIGTAQEIEMKKYSYEFPWFGRF